jgi:hypothetical protein
MLSSLSTCLGFHLHFTNLSSGWEISWCAQRLQ